MAVSAFLAPNARWQGRDPTGQPIVGGKLYTYINLTDDPKETWQDFERTIENTNPVILDAKGEANIYWDDDVLYRIVLTTADDQEVYTQDYYPITKPTTVPSNSTQNASIVRNPQFTFWSNTLSFSNPNSVNVNDTLADDWLYQNDCTGQTYTVSRQTFDLGQTDVPGNPIYFCRYQMTATGTAQNYNDQLQNYVSVQTLADQTVNVLIYLKSSTNSTVGLVFEQNFGTGGSPSPSVVTNIGACNLTSAWQKFQFTVTLPNVDGKTLGSNGDDCLKLRLQFPINAIATIDYSDAQITAGDHEFPFLYLSQDDQFKRLNKRVTDGIYETGDYRCTLANTARTGWILCNDTTMGNAASGAGFAFLGTKALFILIWDSVANTFAPIFNSDGTVGSRGANAEADYNANKRLALTKVLGRVIAAAGAAASYTAHFTASTSTDELTVPVATSFYTGALFQVSSTGTLPAPLAPATTYYAIPSSATTFKVATTLANAVAGTFVDITTTGTGTHTVVLTTASTHLVGEFLGEERDALTIAEIPSHTHEILVPDDPIVAGPGAVRAGPIEQPSAPTGGSQAHNNIQPTLYVNVMLKL